MIGSVLTFWWILSRKTDGAASEVLPAALAAGGLSMLIGAELLAPHGGLFVLLIPNAITPVFMYLVALLSK